jgi:hypothetical protein
MPVNRVRKSNPTADTARHTPTLGRPVQIEELLWRNRRGGSFSRAHAFERRIGKFVWGASSTEHDSSRLDEGGVWHGKRD